MTVVNDLISVENFVKARYPAPAHTYKQVPPKRPDPKTFTVRLLDDGRVTETGYHTRVDRAYQIVYIDTGPAEVLTVMDDLSRVFMDGTVIPINASARFIRVGAFSFSAPFQTENDQYAVIGVMRTEIREARTQDNSPLIGEIHLRINTEGE